jgi:hypothetical protein
MAAHGIVNFYSAGAKTHDRRVGLAPRLEIYKFLKFKIRSLKRMDENRRRKILILIVHLTAVTKLLFTKHAAF